LIYWMIAAAVLALGCAALGIFCGLLKRQLRTRTDQESAVAELEREVRIARGGDIRRRREIARLHQALDEEEAAVDALTEETERLREALEESERRTRAAELRRTAAEKEIYAGQMKLRLLEKQAEDTEQAMRAQEQLYQDILREREAAIARLQEGQKRKQRKKPEVLEQQITLDDLLGG